MAVLDPDHLLDQALKLIETSGMEQPRQVDLRRAVSAAYYAVFHAVATSLADEYIGEDQRSSVEYQLAYRSVNHRWLKQLCEEAAKPTPGKRLRAHLPEAGFSDRTRIFAAIVPKLQELRHTADYDPRARFQTAEAIAAIDQSRQAVKFLLRAHPRSRRRFLALLAFAPRGGGE